MLCAAFVPSGTNSIVQMIQTLSLLDVRLWIMWFINHWSVVL